MARYIAYDMAPFVPDLEEAKAARRSRSAQAAGAAEGDLAASAAEAPVEGAQADRQDLGTAEAPEWPIELEEGEPTDLEAMALDQPTHGRAAAPKALVLALLVVLALALRSPGDGRPASHADGHDAKEGDQEAAPTSPSSALPAGVSGPEAAALVQRWWQEEKAGIIAQLERHLEKLVQARLASLEPRIERPLPTSLPTTPPLPPPPRPPMARWSARPGGRELLKRARDGIENVNQWLADLAELVESGQSLRGQVERVVQGLGDMFPPLQRLAPALRSLMGGSPLPLRSAPEGASADQRADEEAPTARAAASAAPASPPGPLPQALKEGLSALVPAVLKALLAQGAALPGDQAPPARAGEAETTGQESEGQSGPATLATG